MPSLDTRGIIAAAQIGFYFPVAAISLFLVIRYGFRRDAGWLFLFIFALARMAGGALIVAAELIPNPMVDLFIAAYILHPAGLALLFFSTLGFIGLAGYHSYSDVKRMMMAFRIVGVVALIAMILSIVGGILGTHVSPATGNIGMILRRAAAGAYGGVWVMLTVVHILCWSYRYELRSYRRNLLAGITLAHPILGARVAYAILSAWSSSDVFGTQLSSNSTFKRFNPITGEWVLFLTLSLITEFVVCAMYLLFSTVLSQRRS